MRNTVYLAAAAALCLAAPAAYAQGSAATQAAATAARGSTQALSGTDKTWLQSVADGSAYELQLAQLAVQKASKPAVKNYAEVLVKDHAVLNASMQEIADKHGVKMTPAMDAKDKSRLSELQGKSGADFDRAFLAEMKRINGEDKGKLQKEIAATKDSQVKAFAQAMQSADQRHEQMAQKIDM